MRVSQGERRAQWPPSRYGAPTENMPTHGAAEEFITLHKDYAELFACAESSCALCMYFARELYYSPHSGAIDSAFDSQSATAFKVKLLGGFPAALTWSVDDDDAPCEMKLRAKWLHHGWGSISWPAHEIADRNLRVAGPDAQELLGLSLRWLVDCLYDHQECGRRAVDTGPFLPTRLLDVGEAGQQEIRLVLCEDLLAEEQYEYVTLSYCWGRANRAAHTTVENLAERLHTIRLASLPETIRDAVAITRALDVRYLWVDALCIIQVDQGDNEDWQRESANMGKIYGTSVLTIAASGAADSSKGCFHRTPVASWPARNHILTQHQVPQLTRRNDIVLEASLPKWTAAVERSALARRGWALQERMLASRKLFWTADGLFWECGELRASEYGPIELDLDEFPTLLELAASIQGRSSLWQRNAWARLVEEYSRKALTVATDRLSAVLGLGRTLSDLTDQKYEMGLWTNNVVRELAWHAVSDPEGSRISSVPSWSWASTTQAVGFQPRQSEITCSALATVSISNGQIQVRGQLGRLRLTPLDDRAFIFSFDADDPHLIRAHPRDELDELDVDRKHGLFIQDILEDGPVQGDGAFEYISWIRWK
ncbi:HET-domain-containing protein [Didymella exigua CBS 183.55]|uniref:HET-domain-containing protein n=1 Tax=Didymella exigua CBS 183.55 TaxID=1150837 RepID=A0A6A5RTK3_9PLEO|nr:HET-domain-containing protein [Didymella exigua CBS 183.55]KAF1930869.1 HET-domain-containing protein [Didymella exigua CBS 183.55]